MNQDSNTRKKKIVNYANSISKLTHAFTIQPTISIDGSVLSHLLIVFQEINGKFGPEVAKEIENISRKYKNLIILPSKSGKSTKEHCKLWFDKVVRPLGNHSKVLLILDDWSVHTKKDFLESNDSEWCLVKTIPAGTTSMCQPCDVYFFNPYKRFVRRIVVECKRRAFFQNSSESENVDLVYPVPHDRDYSSRVQSLALQVFKNQNQMIKSSWTSAGYQTDLNERNYDLIVQNIFKIKKEKCEELDCGKPQFAICPICKLEVCFDCYVFSENLVHHHFEEGLEPVVLNYNELDLLAKDNRKRSADNLEDDE